MKDISLYTVMVSLKLKEKRELQNWAKKTLSQKYSDNAVKVFQKYLRGEAGAEEDLLRMSGIVSFRRRISCKNVKRICGYQLRGLCI